MSNTLPELFTRREFIAGGVATGGLVAMAGAKQSTGSGAGAASGAFPAGFLWGAATAAHQVEGNNINSDAWVLEHLGRGTPRDART